MSDREIEEILQGVDFVVDDSCYCGKQAQFDYDGGTAADEDAADWFKPKFRGGRLNGIS